MTWWSDFRKRFGQPRADRPAINITTEWGNVTESARFQAAYNFRIDSAKRELAESMIGEDEMRRRYPEAYE